ncbi:MAG: hypothetical protein KAY32_12770 [Candidatus Eisenbacteria sp.]|nr:hypothetical protein [Candidatus Eisenbacteria bacterium]
MKDARWGTLSPGRRRLIRLLQAVNFGEIRNLHVVGGEPVFDPPPRIIRHLKFGSDNGERRERHAEDFILMKQTRELLEALSALRNGHVARIGVKHGVPTDMEMERQHVG